MKKFADNNQEEIINNKDDQILEHENLHDNMSLNQEDTLNIQAYSSKEKKYREVLNPLQKNMERIESNQHKYKANFFEDLNAGKLFSIEEDGTEVVFCYNDELAEDKSGKERLKNRKFHYHNKKAKAEILDTDRVIYKEFIEHSDLEYITYGNRIKENIIVHEKLESYEFGFTFKVKNLEVSLGDNNKSIVFKKTDSKKKIFTIPAPVMFDASGEESIEIIYEIEEVSSTEYIFKVIADKNWINDSTRVFPVTIDPQIVVENIGEIEISDATTLEILEKGKVGLYNGTEKTLRIKVRNPISRIPEGKRIIHAFLCLKRTANVVNSKPRIFSIFNNGNAFDCFWNGDADGFIRIDIAKYISNEDLLFEIKRVSTGVLNDYVEFDASQSYLTFDYLSDNMFDHEESLMNVELGRAGTSMIAIDTGEVAHEHIDIIGSTCGLPLDIKHIYRSSKQSDSKKSLVGNGWKLNVDQEIKKNINKLENEQEGIINTYEDGNGDIHEFIEKYFYVDEDGNKRFIKQNEIKRTLYGNEIYEVDGKKYDIQSASFNQNGDALIADYHYDFEGAVEGILSEKYTPEFAFFCEYNGIIHSFNLSNTNIVEIEIGTFFINAEHFEISLEETFKENGKDYYMFLGTTKVLVTRELRSHAVQSRGSKRFITVTTGIAKTSSVKKAKMSNRGPIVEKYYTTTKPISNSLIAPLARPTSILSDIILRTTSYEYKYTYYYKEIEIRKKSGEISRLLPKSYRTEELLGLESRLIQIYDAIIETTDNLVQLGEDYRLFSLQNQIKADERSYSEMCEKFNEDKQDKVNVILDLTEVANAKGIESSKNIKNTYVAIVNEADFKTAANKCSANDLNKIISSLQVQMQRDEINFTEQNSKLKSTIEENTKQLLDAQNYNQEESFNKTKKRLEDNLEKYIEMRKEVCQVLGNLIEEYKKQPLDYILYSSGMVLGFNYNGKLVDIGNAEKSKIQIGYDGHVIANLQTDEKIQVSFHYTMGELLQVEDPRGRIIHFEYDNPTNHQLKRIIYPDTSETLLEYLGDGIEVFPQKRLLSKLTDQNGTQTQITYDNEKASNIKIIPFSEVESSLPLEFNKSIWRSGNGTVKVTDEISKKRINYIIDVVGRVVTTYEDETELTELNQLKSIKSIKYNHATKKTKYTIIPKGANIGHVLSGFETDKGLLNCYNTNTELVTSHFVEGEQSAKIMGQLYKENSIARSLKPKTWPKNGIYAVSMWAKAKSLLTVTNQVLNVEESICQNVDVAAADYYRRERRFRFYVDIKFNGVVEQTLVYDFDCHNEDWQLGVVLVKLKPEYEENFSLFTSSIHTQYFFNNGDAYFDDVRITECDYVMEESDDEGRVILTEDGDYRTTFSDFSGTQPRTIIKTSMKDATKQFVTKNIYNQQKQLVWSQDHAGMITEHKYDEDGNRLLSKTYHQEEPTSAFITEYHSDDEGRTSKEIDARGEEDGIELSTKYTYLDTSEIVTSIEDARGHKTFYGYDYNNDNLLSISSSVNGEKNHILRTYEKGKITKLTQNDTDYEYQYDGLNRITEFKIAGVHYLTNEYGYSEDGEFSVVKTIDGKHEVTITESSLNGEEVNTYRMIDDDEVLVSEYKKIDDDSYTVNEPLSGRSVQVSKDRKKHLQGTTTVIDRLTTTGDILDTVKTTLNIDGTISTREVEYHYNDEYEHKLQSIKFKEENQSQTFKQDLLNRMSEIATLSNNQKVLTTSYNYLQNGDHATNLVKSVKTTTKNRSSNTRYTYDGNGNITSITKKGEIKQRFKYDSLNRLIREDNLDLNVTLIWEYDISGNILAKSECVFTLIDNLDVINRHEYTYNENWKDQLSYYNDEECLYDEIGNPFKYRNQTLVWENGRQLKKFRDVEFKYTNSGIRYEKKSNGVVTTYYLDGSTILSEKRGSDVLIYQYGLNGISGFSLNNTHYIYEKNLQGDIIAIYNASGDKCAEYTYDSWGQVRVTNIIGTIGEINPFRYRSYYYDEETGLYYLKSRYYDPETGRFINADDISYLNPESINGLNLYSYCGNNPVMNVDPNGNVFFSILLALGVAALAGAVVGVAGQFVGDIVTSIFTGEFHFSSWEEYLGSALGGAVGGMLSLIPGFGFAAAVIGGTLGTFNGYAIGKATGSNQMSWEEIGYQTSLSFIINIATAGITKYARIPGITKGSHSFTQVWKSGITKTFQNGSSMALKTAAKGFVSTLVSEFGVSFLASSSLQGIFDALFIHLKKNNIFPQRFI